MISGNEGSIISVQVLIHNLLLFHLSVKSLFIRMLHTKIYKSSGYYDCQRTDYKKKKSGTHVFIIFPGKPGVPWKNNNTSYNQSKDHGNTCPGPVLYLYKHTGHIKYRSCNSKYIDWSFVFVFLISEQAYDK